MDLFGEEGGRFSQELILPFEFGDPFERRLVGRDIDRLRRIALPLGGDLSVSRRIDPAPERVLRRPSSTAMSFTA